MNTRTASGPDGIMEFTPATLAGLSAPPVFMLKAGTRRDRDRFSHSLMREGLKFHGREALRQELVTGLQHLWSEEDFAAEMPRIRALWTALDEHDRANAHLDQSAEFTFDPSERARIEKLIDRAHQAWQPLREAAADNATYARLFPHIAASHLIAGWSGIDLPFRREPGHLSLDVIERLETALGKVEDQARADQVEGVGETGTAFLELCAAAGARLFAQAKHEPASAPAEVDQ